MGTSWRGEGWQASPGWSESLHDLQCGQNVRMLVLAPGHIVNKKVNIIRAVVGGLVLTMTKLHCLEISAFPLPKLDTFAWPLTLSSKSCLGFGAWAWSSVLSCRPVPPLSRPLPGPALWRSLPAGIYHFLVYLI